MDDSRAAGNPLMQYFLHNDKGRGIHKWTHYFDVYHRSLARYRNQPVTFLEIGVQNGGSLHMWRHYFGPQAKIIGVDIDPNCKSLENEGFEIWIGDQADDNFWAKFCGRHPQLDIVLDDGGHTMQQQVVTFECLFSVLRDGGTYLCEDTHTSYFPKFGGGLKSSGGFLEYAKSLIDEQHAWYHSPVSELPYAEFAKDLYAICIYDSIVVMEKQRREPPRTLSRGPGGHVINPEAMTFLDMRRRGGVADT